DLEAHHVLPAAGLLVDVGVVQPDHVQQVPFGEAMLAHDVGDDLGALGGEADAPLVVEVEQPVALHPGDGLGDRGSGVPEPLGDAGAHRGDAGLVELEHRLQVHLGGVDEISGHRPLLGQRDWRRPAYRARRRRASRSPRAEPARAGLSHEDPPRTATCPGPPPVRGTPASRSGALGAGAQAGPWMISRRRASVAVGVLPPLTPAASRASFFAWAVPAEPDAIAPAWPVVLPSGAVKPAT